MFERSYDCPDRSEDLDDHEWYRKIVKAVKDVEDDRVIAILTQILKIKPDKRLSATDCLREADRLRLNQLEHPSFYDGNITPAQGMPTITGPGWNVEANVTPSEGLPLSAIMRAVRNPDGHGQASEDPGKRISAHESLEEIIDVRGLPQLEYTSALPAGYDIQDVECTPFENSKKNLFQSPRVVPTENDFNASTVIWNPQRLDTHISVGKRCLETAEQSLKKKLQIQKDFPDEGTHLEASIVAQGTQICDSEARSSSPVTLQRGIREENHKANLASTNKGLTSKVG